MEWPVKKINTLRFGMLKQWCQNENLADIDVEEKYSSWVANLRSDRYVTATWQPLLLSPSKLSYLSHWFGFVSPSKLAYLRNWYCLQVTELQLEKMYGKGSEAKLFIAELIKGYLVVNDLILDWYAAFHQLSPHHSPHLIALPHLCATPANTQGQAGVPHPQVPQVWGLDRWNSECERWSLGCCSQPQPPCRCRLQESKRPRCIRSWRKLSKITKVDPERKLLYLICIKKKYGSEERLM